MDVPEEVRDGVGKGLEGVGGGRVRWGVGSGGMAIVGERDTGNVDVM